MLCYGACKQFSQPDLVHGIRRRQSLSSLCTIHEPQEQPAALQPFRSHLFPCHPQAIAKDCRTWDDIETDGKVAVAIPGLLLVLPLQLCLQQAYLSACQPASNIID